MAGVEDIWSLVHTLNKEKHLVNNSQKLDFVSQRSNFVIANRFLNEAMKVIQRYRLRLVTAMGDQGRSAESCSCNPVWVKDNLAFK